MNEKKKTIGIRVPANNIALALLEASVSRCSPPILILPESEMAEFDPEEIADKLGKQLDLVVNGGYLGEQPTTVVDFSDDEPVLRRRGAGDPTPFE
jgi:tRNA A37 threonylcarbamoyladenosine synthetase subunit TsaC/SUA5/YrdC